MKTMLTGIATAVFVVFPYRCFASYVRDYSGSEVHGLRLESDED